MPKLVSGFSLVEMLVAIGIFMTIMTIAVSSLISIIGANKKAQAIKSTIDSITFAVENISRDMRMGTGYSCLLDNDTYSNDCPLDTGSVAVRYINSSGKTITYKFDSSLLNSESGVLTKTDEIGTTDLISSDSNVNIKSMKFYVIGADKEFASMFEKTQPRVIITVSGLISIKGQTDTTFNLQTSFSQRIRR